jgi:hypothetical protein
MDSAYPKPDRSNVPRNFTKTPENDVIDVGWQEGVLKDGRPFHGEYWAQDQVGVMTFFFSTVGIENSTKKKSRPWSRVKVCCGSSPASATCR